MLTALIILGLLLVAYVMIRAGSRPSGNNSSDGSYSYFPDAADTGHSHHHSHSGGSHHSDAGSHSGGDSGGGDSGGCDGGGGGSH